MQQNDRCDHWLHGIGVLFIFVSLALLAWSINEESLGIFVSFIFFLIVGLALSYEPGKIEQKIRKFRDWREKTNRE
jgi:predicted membrane channel-forming protein YqfA (hemolysin III family)